MEAWHSYGTTGSTTDTSMERETCNVSFRDKCSSYAKETDERRPSDATPEYLKRMERQSNESTENVNGNQYICVTTPNSSYRSGSELTSDSDYTDATRRDSNHSDSEVFLPLQQDVIEQRKILDQKMRELRGNQRSWKRVVDYVNGLPVIPEPLAEEGTHVMSTQAKRQRIWSETHETRKEFVESGRMSYAGGTSTLPKLTRSSSSNLSQLSSLSSNDSSFLWFKSAEDMNRTLVSSSHLSSPPHSPSPWQQPSTRHTSRAGYNETEAIKLSTEPTTILNPSTKKENRDLQSGVISAEGSIYKREESFNQSRDKTLQRRWTNSDLIALASQHRQQHSIHRRRQNLLRMGSSNLSEESDNSGNSFSSIDDLLIARHDPEEMLLNLGFGGSPQEDFLDRIPSRFLQHPSQANGISLQGFLNQIDELERGCGFSLVGGLRGLGSAIRRSSQMITSPLTSRGPAPSQVTNGNIHAHTRSPAERSDEQNNNSSPRSKIIFPETAVTDHSSKHSGIMTIAEHQDDGAVVTKGSSQESATVVENSNQNLDNHKQTEDAGDLPALRPRIGLPQSLPPVNENVHSPRMHLVSQSNFSYDTISTNLLGGSAHDVDIEKSASRQSRDGWTRQSTNPKSSDGLEPSSEKNNPRKGYLQPSFHQTRITSGMFLETREDSLEFEELSSGDQEMAEDQQLSAQAAQEGSNNQGGSLSRSESAHSDSSGFADEGIGSGELSSSLQPPMMEHSTTSDFKNTQTSFESEEPLDSCDKPHIKHSCKMKRAEYEEIDAQSINQELHDLQSVGSLEESPFDDSVMATEMPARERQRSRASTYPNTQDKEKNESGPKNVIEILSTLQMTSERAKQENLRRRIPPKLLKMKSVDPECYSFKSMAEHMKNTDACKSEEKLSRRLVSDAIENAANKPESATCGLDNGDTDHETKHVASRPGDTIHGHQRGHSKSVTQSIHQMTHNMDCMAHPVDQVVYSGDQVPSKIGDMHEIGDINYPHLIVPTPISSSTQQETSSPSVTNPDSSNNTIPDTSHHTFQDNCVLDGKLETEGTNVPSDSLSNVITPVVVPRTGQVADLQNRALQSTAKLSLEDRPPNLQIGSTSEALTSISDGERCISGSHLSKVTIPTSSTVIDDLQGQDKIPLCRDEMEVKGNECSLVNRETDDANTEKSSASHDHTESHDPVTDRESALNIREEFIQPTAEQVVSSSRVDPVSDEQMSWENSHWSCNPVAEIGMFDHVTQPIKTHSLCTTSELSPVQDSMPVAKSPGPPLSCDMSQTPAPDPTKEDGQPVMPSAPSRSKGGTRIEVMSEEIHAKAREELKALLAAEVQVDLPTLPTLSSNEAGVRHETVEDLKLLQRALIRYHQDLNDLEMWSARLYQDIGHELSREERDDLGSVYHARHQIKWEVQSLEKMLMQKYQSIVAADRDKPSAEENFWSPSLTQIMCEMVQLLNEQNNLRLFLEELHFLDQPSSSQQKSPEKNVSDSMTDVGDTDRGSREGSNLGDLDDLDDLTFPQVMTRSEMMHELVKAQSDIRRMRIKAKHDVMTAVREAKDVEIEKLRAIVKQLGDSSRSDPKFGSASSK